MWLLDEVWLGSGEGKVCNADHLGGWAGADEIDVLLRGIRIDFWKGLAQRDDQADIRRTLASEGRAQHLDSFAVAGHQFNGALVGLPLAHGEGFEDHAEVIG